jgi:hypothetical protein
MQLKKVTITRNGPKHLNIYTRWGERLHRYDFTGKYLLPQIDWSKSRSDPNVQTQIQNFVAYSLVRERDAIASHFKLDPQVVAQSLDQWDLAIDQ